MIRYKCVKCTKIMESPDALAGSTDICPICTNVNAVPAGATVMEETHNPLSNKGTIIALTCPKCRKEASEYAPGKWRCLYCGRKFAYEPPRQPDKYIRVENISITSLAESSFFVCAECKGKFPLQAYAQFRCKRCKKPLCSDHFGVGCCSACLNAMKTPGRTIFLGVLAILTVFALLIWLLS